MIFISFNCNIHPASRQKSSTKLKQSYYIQLIAQFQRFKMISQADIIKTLINKNCTDESIMSTALSPDCKSPRLLEKLTEAERFDLALDISMKLGLDVIQLWKTWAMRCLKNRNFQGAREKFCHCFLMMRPPGGRTNPIQSKLLADILEELSKMDETRLSLTEEVELIKHRRLSKFSTDTNVSVMSKPTIFAECNYYLKKYGGVEDSIRFYLKSALWDEVVKVLLEKSSQINLNKFFIREVVLYSTSTGKFSNLIESFLKLDLTFQPSLKYFKVMYDFCLRNKRYHLLYYIQSTIGDYIAAANTQINHFFLKKPTKSYRELNYRISILTTARKNYQDYLDLLKSDNAEIVKKYQNNSLFSSLPQNAVEVKLKIIDLQIEITRNFAINEVSGCVNGIELSVDNPKEHNEPDDSPVTMFEESNRRKVFLAALVLIYYDPLCSSYFSKSGLDLANKLISDHGLDKVVVFKTAMRIIIEDDSCDILENASLLIECIKQDYVLNKASYELQGKVSQSEISLDEKSNQSRSATKFSGVHDAEGSLRQKNLSAGARAICDEVIRDSIGSCREADYKMELAKLLSGEAKIELYIEHGKLSNAQMLACTMNRPDYVSSIIEEASKLNQNHVKTVCQLWLAKHETKNSMR